MCGGGCSTAPGSGRSSSPLLALLVTFDAATVAQRALQLALRHRSLAAVATIPTTTLDACVGHEEHEGMKHT